MTATLLARGAPLCLIALAICTSRAWGQTNGSGSLHGNVSIELNCGSCHTPNGWRPTKSEMDFDHDKSTGFDLTGRHKGAGCTACHLGARFDEPKLSTGDCSSCHVDVHLGNLSDNCQGCHSTTDFYDIAGLSIHSRTSFPLTGAHVQVSCESCHIDDRGGAFSALDPSCFSCHEQDYNSAQSLDHASLLLSTTCEDCHGTLGWGGTGIFDHATASNGFDLTGAHAAIRCESCHIVPGLAPIFAASDESDCIACHSGDFQREHEPGFPTDCLACHSTDNWEGEELDHVEVSNGFDLVGAHSSVDCGSCHIIPGFEPIFQAVDQDDCFACHLDEYQLEHGDGFPTDCLACHNNVTWEGADFDHAASSNGFALIGAHITIACESCHIIPGFDPIYQATDENDCVGCHQDDYDREHAGTGFPTDCLTCHTVDSWLEVSFEDHDQQFFPIFSGPHNGKWDDCTTCHTVPNDFTSFSCFLGCHAHDQAAMDNKHSDVGGYAYESQACLSCHPDGRTD